MNYTRIYKMDTLSMTRDHLLIGSGEPQMAEVGRHESVANMPNEGLAAEPNSFVQRQRPKTRENTRNATLMTI